MKTIKRPGDTQLGCTRLPVNTASPSIDQDVEFPRQFGADQRLLDLRPQSLRGKVTLESTPIDNQLALAGPKNDSGYRRFATSRRPILSKLCHRYSVRV